MGIIAPTLPQPGSPRGSEEQDVANALQAILTLANGQLDGDNIANASIGGDELQAAVREVLGVNSTGVVRRGKSIVATEESRTNTVYGTLSTPDQVQNVVLPTDGLIVVAYQAEWKESVLNAAKAAIFIGSNQLKEASSDAAPVVQEVEHPSDAVADRYRPIFTTSGGLDSVTGPAYTGDVTTGQLVGAVDGESAGVIYVFAAAGTYTVSVQFKASSGSVTAKNRKLWVEARGYG